MNRIEEKFFLKPFFSTSNERREAFKTFDKKMLIFNFGKFELAFSELALDSVCLLITHEIFRVYSNSNQTTIGITCETTQNSSAKALGYSDSAFKILPITVDHKNSSLSLAEKIKIIETELKEMLSHSDVDLSKIISKDKNLFDAVITFENPVDFIYDFNIVILKNESLKTITIELIYSSGIFDVILIDDFLSMFDHLLTQFALADSNKKIEELDFLIPEQKNRLLNEFNDTYKEYPQQKLINQLFEEAAETYSNRIALIYDQVQLTYKELNEKANKLSNYLKESFNIQPDDIIALCLEKSDLMIITIIAIWKSGAAYVPIDPFFPNEKIKYILENTKSKVLLANKIYSEKISELEKENNLITVYVDDENLLNELASFSCSNVPNTSKSNNLAYVIYTSGTTGQPKGVMVEHRALIANILPFNQYFFEGDLNAPQSQVIIQLFNYAFDASITDILFALLHGSKLVVPNKNIFFELNAIDEFINKHKITFLFSSPSIARSIQFKKTNSLRYLLLGGEKLTNELYNQLKDSLNNECNIFNLYGPTECVIISTINKFIKKNNVTIGKPLKNYKCYVLNSSQQLVPIGAKGELYIGGSCLSRGYLNRPDLTKEKFIPNPFQQAEDIRLKTNQKFYKTGDMVRWLHDGSIDYLGRNDFQVKINGFRVELEDIELAISKYLDIKACAVVAQDKEISKNLSHKYLVAYYVSKNKIDENELKNFLKQKLADYMVPSFFIHLENLPINANGKLDTKALPVPEKRSFKDPRNETEKKLQEIFSSFFGIEAKKISINDDFFMLGGDSIVSVQLVSKIKEELDYHVKSTDVFIYKTIESIYENVIHKQINSSLKTLFVANK